MGEYYLMKGNGTTLNQIILAKEANKSMEISFKDRGISIKPEDEIDYNGD